MRTIISQRESGQDKLELTIILVKGKTHTEILGRIKAIILPESSYLVMSKPNIVNPVTLPSSNILLALFKAAEGQAFLNQCSAIYGAAYGEDEKEAFVKRGFKPCKYEFQIGDTGDKPACWYLKESASMRPVVLVVYTKDKITSIHTTYKSIRNPLPA